MAEIDWIQVKKNVNTLITWTYWIVGTIVVFTISYVLYTRFNKQVASILVFIASMMAMYYYYVKWFIVGQPFPVPAQTCPDFMESIGVTTDTTQTVCVARNTVYPNVTKFEGDVDSTIKDASEKTNKGQGLVVETGTKVGYVIPPNTNNVDSYCGKLKQHHLSHVNLCSFA